MAAKLPQGTRVVLPGAGHVLNLDQPEGFVREVDAFCRGFDRPCPAVIYFSRACGRRGGVEVTWIFLMMLGMIGGSIAVELILPERLKQTLGNAICWMMMAVTMTSLGIATIALLVVTWLNFIQPMITSAPA